ncbi:outer membrane beta-barrel protein [Helicobacter didelphidarum]|uniref:outer membrane beta-barrel protein n=1 Tax=Helicobacter didelphidarum TaxID=2040648 RepID=UPI000E1E3A64|nr:outer membrane beta-barrel protein [Helicobacter didelphidarum]
MKRFLSIVALSALLVSNGYAEGESVGDESGEKSGFFIGTQVGGSILGLSSYENNKKVDAASETKGSFNVGVKLGWNQFFTPLIGLRGYVTYDFDGLVKFQRFGDISATYQNIATNMDLLLNFINTDSFSMAIFAGFGLGYGITTLSDKIIADGLKLLTDYNGFNIPH